MEIGTIKLGGNSIDLSGQVFSRLIALKPIGRTKGSKIIWLCRCECGNITQVQSSNLTLGKVRSCGCISIERISNLNKTHGLSKTPIYRIWSGMINRCTDSKSVGYHNYGGRNIEVCPEWAASFESFYAHVSTLSFFGQSGYSIDRIDNSKGYFPGNVQWSDIQTQARNKRNNVNLTYNGKTQCLAAWSRELGISHATLHKRLKRGWSAEKTLSTLI